MEKERAEQIEAEIADMGNQMEVLRQKRVTLRHEVDEYWRAEQQKIRDNPSEVPPQRIGEGAE